MNRFRLTKRRAGIAVLLLIPLLLFAVIRERRSWQPRTLPLSADTKIIYQLLWMPDSKTLLVEDSINDQLQFWDTDKKVLSRSLNVDADPGSLRLLPNGSLLYHDSGTKSGCDCWTIWDLQKKKPVPLRIPISPSEFFNYNISTDGKQMIEGQQKGDSIMISTLDRATGRLLTTSEIKPPSGKTFEDGNLAMSGNSGAAMLDDKLDRNQNSIGILLFEAQAAKRNVFLPASLLPPSHQLISFSTDGTTFFISGKGGCQLRDAQTGKLKISVHHPMITPWMRWLQSSGSKPWLLAYDTFENEKAGILHKDIIFYIWDIATGKLLREVKVNQCIYAMALSPDGSTLAVSTQNSVKLYRMR